ncbi:hypothetical protein ACFSUS_10230 [Spirosoma soli]|uniref:Uncharacterized protein n=1 Tax=Spirosoma soli TaxID=1770529 RepID=A0ABW5M4H7_9BACT
MKTRLTISFVGLRLIVSAQTIVKSMQTTNNDKTLAMNIVGKRDGRPFRHNLHFDVEGLTQMQRDSLYEQTLHTLGVLGIKNVPGLKPLKSTVDEQNDNKAQESSAVTFGCETCTGKGRLEVYGNNFLMTRSFNTKRDAQPLFPLTVRLSAGQYRNKYWQNGVLQTELPFTVNAGEANEVKIK